MADAALTPRIVWIDGGRSHVGTDTPHIPADGEGPARPVKLRPYGIAATTATNAAFAAFVEATGYVSQAERIGWSYVFRGLLRDSDARSSPDLPWWLAVKGAFWAAPLGPGSTWEECPAHPVVHVSHADALAFAAHAGGRLPTEAEWEHAARGGPDPATYPWGAEDPDDETIRCNIWQGRFPDLNTERDGYYGASPVDAFPPNALGLHNMSGNVWEWCADPFRIRSLSRQAKTRNREAAQERERVLKGGSFLCHASYCWRYRIAARTGRAPDSAASHVGFRLAFGPSG